MCFSRRASLTSPDQTADGPAREDHRTAADGRLRRKHGRGRGREEADPFGVGCCADYQVRATSFYFRRNHPPGLKVITNASRLRSCSKSRLPPSSRNLSTAVMGPGPVEGEVGTPSMCVSSTTR